MKRQWMTADPIEYELLKANARSNRKSMTEAESSFWSMVKGNALGERCLRQHVIGDYIVDFIFRKSKLVVEIDGEYHESQEQQLSDTIRSEYLESMGCQVIRFTNEQVLFNPEYVISKLKVSLNREI
ncbi:MAG: DUF559 domain-containing protein [Prevotella sp.]|nr:DUF559 domain-containing protein [Prevotella sp.]